jgi:hypothetical protein
MGPRPSVARVTSWYPGDGDRGEEILLHGDDASPARPVRLLAVGLAVLALGVVLGAQSVGRLPWTAASDTPVQPVGGIIERGPSTSVRHSYQLSLYNPGNEPITVRIVGIDGRAVTVTATRPTRVAPGDWARVMFSLPDECSSPAVPPASAVVVRTVGGGLDRIPLAEPGTALSAHHDRECARPTALQRQDLRGLWHLEEVEGRWTNLAAISLMRFTSTGAFAFDPEGKIFVDGHQGMLGTYRLRGTTLHLHVTGGYACAKGYSEDWTTTRLAKDVLRLDVIRSDTGYCHSPPGERQVLRRLVREDDLPRTTPR